MSLNIQIYSLGYSFIFGIFFYILLELFNKITFSGKLFWKIIYSFIFTIGLSLLYFWGLLYINNGYLHMYFLLMILVGYIIMFYIKKYWLTVGHKKK